VRVSGREGFSLAQDGPYGVALDLDVTPELAAEGAAREVVRAVQDLRKSSGLAVEDRIDLWLSSGDDEVAAALRTHGDMIAREVLAVRTELTAAPAGAAVDDVSLGDGSVRVGLRKSG
jgi:isoleucyl-tRNA synthetase